jgi:hypothetical protein
MTKGRRAISSTRLSKPQHTSRFPRCGHLCFVRIRPSSICGCCRKRNCSSEACLYFFFSSCYSRFKKLCGSGRIAILRTGCVAKSFRVFFATLHRAPVQRSVSWMDIADDAGSALVVVEPFADSRARRASSATHVSHWTQWRIAPDDVFSSRNRSFSAVKT